jgi:two-component system sensor histidine kinase BaeS
MRRSLTFKLVAAFLGVSLIVIALVALSSAAVAALEFNRLVSQEATNTFVSFVTDYYKTHGSLTGIDEALRSSAQPSENAPGEPPRLLPTALTDPSGLVVIGGEGYRSGTKVAPNDLAAGTPIKVNGVVIAVSLPRQLPPPRTRAQEQFIQTAGLALGVAAIGAVLVAVLLGIFLARTITRPVDELTGAARRMAKGDLAQTVNVHSSDEVGELAAAFNQMSADLARADQARRQMTADIAHELRNPLTVMGGYLDAMRAGDLQPTPARLEAVYEEIENLERLVEDLRTLSLADAGALSLNRQPLAPGELLNRVATRYAQQAEQKDVALSVQAEPKLPKVEVDEARMMQVFSNLVSNALRYTPPHGQVRLSADARGKSIRFQVTDTGDGIQPEDLPRVFDRFYRADHSRFGGNGELGLGLAIAKAFVQAHGGKIGAESTPGKGTTFVVEVPTS